MRTPSISLKSILPIFLAALLIFGCNASRTTKGGLIGAGAGGAVGGVIGAVTGNTAAGAIIGATVGGATGAVIGRYMDKQAKEIEQEVPNAKVERVGEGIRVTLPEGILFGFNSDQLSAQADNSVQDMARILKKYNDTDIVIEGHTDNKGAEQYNQKLSERRAKAVASRLKELGVGNNRLDTKGYGLAQPVAANDTDAGRAQNRRVEVAIFANDQLKEKAKQGDIKVD